jgi:hypothetical protein
MKVVARQPIKASRFSLGMVMASVFYYHLMNIKPLKKSSSVAREGTLYLRIPIHKRRGGILQLLLKSERGLTATGLGPQPFIKE